MNILNNEKGNMSLLMIAIIGGILILFVFILNLSKVLAVKEQADTTTQQASLAATSVIYDHIGDSIHEYDQTLVDLDPLVKLLSEKVNDLEHSLSGDPKYKEYSENEIKMEAIDLAIKSELSSGYKPSSLKNILEGNLEGLLPDMVSVAREVIKENKGNLDGAEMQFKDNRIYIKASNEFKASSYEKLFEGFHQKLFRKSAGPEIDFLNELSIWKEPVSLDDGNIKWE